MISRSLTYEGVIYAGTAVSFGALTFAITAVTIEMAAKINLAEVLSEMLWATLGGLTLITLIRPSWCLPCRPTSRRARRSHVHCAASPFFGSLYCSSNIQPIWRIP